MLQEYYRNTAGMLQKYYRNTAGMLQEHCGNDAKILQEYCYTHYGNTARKYLNYIMKTMLCLYLFASAVA